MQCNVISILYILNIDSVMCFNLFFTCNVRCNEPGIGQRGLGFRGKQRIIALKSRAMAQYGGGRGGVLLKKKRFRQTPLSSFDVFMLSSFFKKYCIIL